MLLRAFCILSAGLAMAQTAADPAATAKKAFDLLLGEKYAELPALFTAEMQKAYPAAELVKIGERIKSFGAVGKVDSPLIQKSGSNTVAVFPVHFDKQNVNFRYIVNQGGLISGMFLLPGEVSWQRPPYSKPDSFTEREVTVGADQWKLPGTLTVPAGTGPFPGVVLVHSTGPNDRDETVFGTKVFKDLAEGLSSRGIMVLRYEKRTKQYPNKLAGLHGKTVDEETVEDAARAAELLRTQKEVDQRKIFVIGHGLGGYVGPRIAEQDGKLAGLVILAGNARPIEDVIVGQAEYLGIAAKDLEGIRAAAKRVKVLEQADIDAPNLLGLPASYLLDLKTYDPVDAAKRLPIPLLVLQGERDFQSNMKDFALWKAGLASRKDVVLKSYPALNHLFVAGEGKSTEAEYRKPGHVAPEVVDDIAKWVTH